MNVNRKQNRLFLINLLKNYIKLLSEIYICIVFFQFLKIRITSHVVSNFFKKLVMETMEHREKKGIVRHDMIHLLMEAKKGTLVYEEDTKDTSETGFATVQESVIGQKQIMRSMKDIF